VRKAGLASFSLMVLHESCTKRPKPNCRYGTSLAPVNRIIRDRSKHMSLPDRYRSLLDLFDQVLGLSHMILSELEMGGRKENLEELLRKKDAAGAKIEKLTREIASSDISIDSQSNLKTLAQVRPILRQIEKKASLLNAVERRIRELAKQKGKS
jgi:hypothetical protein